MRTFRQISLAVATGTLLTLLFMTSIRLALPANASAPRALLGTRTLESMTYTNTGALQDSQADISETLHFASIEVLTSSAKISNPNALALELALAMDIPPDEIGSATLMCNAIAGGCTDPKGVAVLGLAPGTWYPTRGESFAILSTGIATDILQVGQGPLSPTLEVLGGLNNPLGEDLVQLHLTLNAPEDAICLGFDFTFYTVDIYSPTQTMELPVAAPQQCSLSKGDTFSAQYNDSSMEVVGTTVSAAGNFACNLQNEVVTTLSMSPTGIYQALSSSLGHTIPGIFPLLQARQAVVGGDQVDLYFSIQDVQDSYANSAVALDNFFWITNTTTYTCPPGIGWSGDSDGDGLPDGWELHGVYARNQERRLEKIDLKALGAVPTIKDIFLEIDAMAPLTKWSPLPASAAITYIVNAFKSAPVDPITPTDSLRPLEYKGIRLHVDYGPQSPLLGQFEATNAITTWQQYAHGGTLTDSALTNEYICNERCKKGTKYLWEELDLIKATNFAPERSGIFHYALAAHKFIKCTPELAAISNGGCDAIKLPQTSGMSRNALETFKSGASDFIVTLGAPYWHEPDKNMIYQQAGTFMHELGHNLGLNHFSTEKPQIEKKPNHLSVMNYLYQTDGLIVADPAHRFDYQRQNMPILSEMALIESIGLNLSQMGITIPYTIGVRHFCQTIQDYEFMGNDARTEVDWSCNGGIEQSPGDYNVTGDTDAGGPILTDLIVYSEWDKLTFTGGQLYRQRSILNPNVCIRPADCSKGLTVILEPGNVMTTETPISITPDIVFNRQYFPPTANLEPSLTLPEELTPELDERIKRYPTPVFLLEVLEELDRGTGDVSTEGNTVWFPENVLPGLGAILEMLISPVNIASP